MTEAPWFCGAPWMAKKKSEAAGRTLPRSVPASQSGGVAERVVRDSFTMPRGDYGLIGRLKVRCIGLGVARSKSELLRAGLAALNEMPDADLTRIVAAVESVKTGRPPGAKKKKKGKRKRSRRIKGRKN